MVLSDQRNVMYVWAAFEAKSPPTRQDLVTLINNYTLYFPVLFPYLSNQKHISGLVMNGNAWADATCIKCWRRRQTALQPMLPMMLIQTW